MMIGELHRYHAAEWSASASVLAPETTVYAACVISLALGLFFIFVMGAAPVGLGGIRPLPPARAGHRIGAAVSDHGVPWGYAYFAAFWYRLFGDRPWIALVIQAAIDASVPMMVYRRARRENGERWRASPPARRDSLVQYRVPSTQAADAICAPIVAALC